MPAPVLFQGKHLRVEATALPGVLQFFSTSFRDARGFFVEMFNERAYAEAGLSERFVQDNQSRSSRNVLRGLHYQKRSPQGKLVRVVRGSVFDVAADIRIGSPTFGQWVGVTLNAEAMNALWVPPGFAHGFCATSDEADVIYKCTAAYDPADDFGIAWNDPTLSITWPVAAPVLSEKDRALPELATIAELPAWDGIGA